MFKFALMALATIAGSADAKHTPKLVIVGEEDLMNLMSGPTRVSHNNALSLMNLSANCNCNCGPTECCCACAGDNSADAECS